jgi:hypothetical protein
LGIDDRSFAGVCNDVRGAAEIVIQNLTEDHERASRLWSEPRSLQRRSAPRALVSRSMIILINLYHI